MLLNQPLGINSTPVVNVSVNLVRRYVALEDERMGWVSVVRRYVIVQS